MNKFQIIYKVISNLFEDYSEREIVVYRGGNAMNLNKEKLKVKIFWVLSLTFAILTLVSGYLVIIHKLNNAGYSVIQMLFTLTFSILYRNGKKVKNNTNRGLLIW